ncbi:ketopantoate reductase C-terminal domain-containing protein [Marinobacter salexigens]|nr:ketopantoate reductase C-terminal domain-containing protein [Marinobacter salexigens]
MRAMMPEVMEVAAADGYPIDELLIDKNIESTSRMPAHKNSMAQD